MNKGDTEIAEVLGDGKRFGKGVKLFYIEQPESKWNDVSHN